MGIPYSFGLADSLLCELSGVTPYEMHTDVGAMIKAADAARPLAERLGVTPPVPHLYGMSYCQISTLGCRVVNGPGLKEPWVEPCLQRPEDIDRLREPEDYLSRGIVPERLELARQLKARRPDAATHIGHDYEGPVTTAALMMGGPAFFMLPFDDPARAHRLLEFCTRTSLNYCRAIRQAQGKPFGGGPAGIPDDFGGMFRPAMFGEFVAPYWDKLYAGLSATRRHLHSELLREGHLPFLAALKIDDYDPSVDQYLPPETLKRACPVPYGLRIWPSMVRDHSAEELVAIYRRYAADGPLWIMFHFDHLAHLPKIEALLNVARELA